MKEEPLLPTFEYSEESGATARTKQESDAAFEAWWSLYPRKDAKAAAKKEWDRLKPGPRLVDQLMAALHWQVRLSSWQDVQFIPHGRKYLHHRRWEDERPQARQPASSGPWICLHLDPCSHRAMCDHKNHMPHKYPKREAS